MSETLKLLVVDDEPDNLELLYRTFRREFQVFRAESGVEALALLEQQGEMALIISDQRMPYMNGTEFLSRTVDRFPDTIRIVVTGYTDAEDLVAAINAGKVFKYITKPWTAQHLKEVVAQAAETYRVIKQRTQVLSRALRQESLSNTIMSAVRGSLDYGSTLQTVVSELGRAFDTDFAVLYPVIYPVEISRVPKNPPENTQVKRLEKCPGESQVPFSYCSNEETEEALPANLAALPALPVSVDIVAEKITINERSLDRIVVPFIDQGSPIATIGLYRENNGRTDYKQWADGTVELLKNVSEQVTLAIAHAQLYQRTHRQSVQMRAELEVARKIQSNLLHQKWPEIPGINIQARCQPAREVGGDFFEVFRHPQGDIWLAVGDVSGKGVPAALFMTSAISILRRELAQENSPLPEKVMHNLNHSLANDLISNNCFITMVLIRYGEKTRQIAYANAGHVYPVVWSHRELVAQRQAGVTADVEATSPAKITDAVKPTYLDVRGVPLGILPTWQANPGELTLSAGDVVLITSDGITEATLPNRKGKGSVGSMLNQAGLWDFLQRQPAELNLDRLLSYIQSPEGEQEDDQTILSLEVTSC